MIDHPPALFTEQAARDLAAKLNADPADDWHYAPKPPPGGRGLWILAIFDESRDFVGYM
ncbi:MAG: hypothetical protein JKY67_00345 [Pseudomonadales bacterium]|nr:hypothetical protein [Pseudomonadales bacterium]